MEWVQKILIGAYIFAVLAIIWYAIEALIDGWYWLLRKQRGIELSKTLLRLLVAWFVAWTVVRLGIMTMAV